MIAVEYVTDITEASVIGSVLKLLFPQNLAQIQVMSYCPFISQWLIKDMLELCFLAFLLYFLHFLCISYTPSVFLTLYTSTCSYSWSSGGTYSNRLRVCGISVCSSSTDCLAVSLQIPQMHTQSDPVLVNACMAWPS